MVNEAVFTIYRHYLLSSLRASTDVSVELLQSHFYFGIRVQLRGTSQGFCDFCFFVVGGSRLLPTTPLWGWRSLPSVPRAALADSLALGWLLSGLWPGDPPVHISRFWSGDPPVHISGLWSGDRPVRIWWGCSIEL